MTKLEQCPLHAQAYHVIHKGLRIGMVFFKNGLWHASAFKKTIKSCQTREEAVQALINNNK